MLGFGLVTIPVEIHTAVRDLGPHFHLLRRSDRSRIGYQPVTSRDGAIVSRDDLVKGYEYDTGRYVVLTDEDFKKAAVKRNSRIDVLDFVEGGDVDDRYFAKPYYLLPGRGGEKAYTLFREALRESGRVGIAKFVLRNEPHLAAVEAIGQALILSTMRFRDELVPVADYVFPNDVVRKPELTMARQLIEALAATWDPDKYTDEYRTNLLQIIKARTRHGKPVLARQEPRADAKVVDLMERLQRSLSQAPGSKAPTRKKARTRSGRTRAARRGRTHAA